jgi:uncharacterized membrane protein
MRPYSRFLVQASMTAAVYAALTILLAPLSFGFVQFRVSEILTVLPAVMPAAIPGLFIGCLIANIFASTFGIIDIIFGSIATLMAALSTYLLRRHRFLFPLPPAIFNGLVVGTYIYLLFNDSMSPWMVITGSIFISELIICYAIGLPLVSIIQKNRHLSEALGIGGD